GRYRYHITRDRGCARRSYHRTGNDTRAHHIPNLSDSSKGIFKDKVMKSIAITSAGSFGHATNYRQDTPTICGITDSGEVWCAGEVGRASCMERVVIFMDATYANAKDVCRVGSG